MTITNWNLTNNLPNSITGIRYVHCSTTAFVEGVGVVASNAIVVMHNEGGGKVGDAFVPIHVFPNITTNKETAQKVAEILMHHDVVPCQVMDVLENIIDEVDDVYARTAVAA